MPDTARRDVVVLPPSPLSTLALAGLVAGTAYVAFSRRTPKALGFTVLTLAAFFVQVADGLWLGGAYGRDLAFVTPLFLGGDWWRAFSYLFVHAHLFHLVGNLFILATAGAILEDRIGPKAWIVLYLGGGALSIGSHMLIYPPGQPIHPAAVGASGAIFALLGALAIVAPQAKVPVPLLLIFWFPAWVAALIFVAFNVGYVFMSGTNVAWWGHFAGMAIGVAAGAALVRRGAVRGAPVRRERLPDAEALAPLATTPRLQGMLDRLRVIRGETPDDAVLAQAWVDRFLASAACPVCGSVGLEGRPGAVRCKAHGHAVPAAPSKG